MSATLVAAVALLTLATQVMSGPEEEFTAYDTKTKSDRIHLNSLHFQLILRLHSCSFLDSWAASAIKCKCNGNAFDALTVSRGKTTSDREMDSVMGHFATEVGDVKQAIIQLHKQDPTKAAAILDKLRPVHAEWDACLKAMMSAICCETPTPPVSGTNGEIKTREDGYLRVLKAKGDFSQAINSACMKAVPSLSTVEDEFQKATGAKPKVNEFKCKP